MPALLQASAVKIQQYNKNSPCLSGRMVEILQCGEKQENQGKQFIPFYICFFLCLGNLSRLLQLDAKNLTAKKPSWTNLLFSPVCSSCCSERLTFLNHWDVLNLVGENSCTGVQFKSVGRGMTFYKVKKIFF